MKAVILAGGLGSRLSEETQIKPKPMVEIGGQPMLWHVMNVYAAFGVTDFVICLGYRGYVIKEYFAHYYLHRSDVTFDLANNAMTVHQNLSEPWTVTLLDTGASTMTGGRLLRALPYVDGQDFCFTYGDGVADIDIAALLETHRRAAAVVTLTAVQPPGRFGSIEIEGDRVSRFAEKIAGDGGWINGGFFVVSSGVQDYLGDDSTVWEQEPLESLAAEGKLAVYRHYGFWHAMDTLRDKENLERLWDSGTAPWRGRRP